MKKRTDKENAAYSRHLREREFALDRHSLVPLNPQGKPYSKSSLKRFAARRARCAKSLADFAVTYCMDDGGFLETPPNGRLLEILDQMQRAVTGSGQAPTPFHIRMSRGHGKTSFVKCAIAYALAYGLRRYVVAVSAGTDGASNIIDEIWGLFEQSPNLYTDFPELCVPIRLAQGNSNRAKRVAYLGKHTAMRKSAKEIRMPEMQGYPATGGVLAARSFGAGTRGLVKNKLRPDLVLFDDVQTDEMADSSNLIRAAERKIDGAFMGLAGHRKKIAALMTSTPIRPFDLSEVYAEKSSWLTFTFPMLSRWPKCWKSDLRDFWGEYFKLKDRDVVSGGDEAGEFYRAHRAEMDAGAEVLNDDNFDAAAGELSAVQHAFNLYYTNGAEAFAAEYQMEPVRPSAIYDLTPDIVRRNLSGVPAFTVPKQTPDVVATIDVMNEAGLRWALVAFGASNVATVVAYGRYPANGRPLFDGKTTTQAQQDSIIDAALQALTGEFLRAPFPIRAIGVDAGWRRRTVATFCQRIEGSFRRVEAMRGVPWKDFTPYTASGALRSGILLADDWGYTERREYGRVLCFHADYWQETAQRAWLNAPFQPGSISLPGTDPAAHKVFADEVCADRLADKDRTRAGVTTWRWNSPVGANHMGDCIKMAFALAYWHKLFSATGAAPTPPPRPPQATDAPPQPPSPSRPRVSFGGGSSIVRFA